MLVGNLFTLLSIFPRNRIYLFLLSQTHLSCTSVMIFNIKFDPEMIMCLHLSYIKGVSQTMPHITGLSLQHHHSHPLGAGLKRASEYKAEKASSWTIMSDYEFYMRKLESHRSRKD